MFRGSDTGGSSREYWAMEATLTQPCRVKEDGPMGCKLLLPQSNRGDESLPESMRRISIG